MGDFHKKATAYLKECREAAWNASIPEGCTPDHICYKCSDAGTFENLKRNFEVGDGTFVYVSMISGRRIAVIGLREPIVYEDWTIRYLELSDQKPDGSQVEGFDHIELLPPKDWLRLDELSVHLQELGMATEWDEKPHHSTLNVMLGDALKVKFTEVGLVEKIREDEFV